MSFIDDIKIGKKLLGGFLIVILLLVVVAMVGYTSMGSMSANSAKIYNDRTVPIDQLGVIAADMQQMRAEIYRYIYVPTARADLELTTIPNLRADISKTMDAYRSSPNLLPEEKASLAKFDTAYAEWNRQYDATIAAAKANDKAVYEAQLLAGSPLVNARTDTVAAYKSLLAINVKEADALNKANGAQATGSSMMMIIAVIVAVIAGLGIAMYLSKSITGPIDQVSSNLREMTRGHLKNRLRLTRKDEIGEMAASMDIFSEDLQVHVIGSLDRISKCDLAIDLKIKDPDDEITPIIMLSVKSLNDMMRETTMLTNAAMEGHLDVRADPAKFQGCYQEILVNMNKTLDAVIGPLNVAAEYVDRISKGDIPARITDKYNGDFNEIKNNLNNCIDNINALVADAGMLRAAAIEGKLATRADAGKHQGDFRKVVQGVDDCLDAVIGPLNVAADYVDRISRGAMPPKITDPYNGDFNIIKNNLNNCIDNINALVVDANMLAKAAVEGKLDTRADAGKHQGDYQKIVRGVNECLDSVIGPLNVAAEYVDRISKGDIPTRITDNYNGDFNEIKNNLNNCIDAVNALVADAGMLEKAAVDGKLATRADAAKHQGDYKKIVVGVNNCLDSVIGPLNVAADYVDKISKGALPKKITDPYNGDFNVIKNNLNNCIDNINALVADANMLAKAAVEGKLDTRADAGKHQGDYQKIVIGVNNCLDSVIGPLNVAAEYVDRISKGDIPTRITDNYNGDFNEIKNNLNNCIDAVNSLVADAGMLAKAADEGKLKTRADASKHSGDYKKIVDGVNQTLDSVIEPVNEALRVSKGYATQDFTTRVDPNLKVPGDWLAFKEALNNIGIAVSAAVTNIGSQVTDLAAGAEEANASVEEVTAGAGQVAKNTGAVSTNVEKSMAGISQVQKAMEDLSRTIQEVATRADVTAKLVQDTTSYSKEGMDLARKTENGMQGITKSSNEVNTIILEIKGQMDKISEIVNLITDLANQTNLLALNAAIEAARAGDAGRGFAVVATEVKSLAVESRASAEKIAEMISNLQTQTNHAVDAVASSNTGVKTGSEALQETLNSFSKIVESIDQVSKNVSDVAAAAEEQAASVEEVTASVNEVGGLMQSTAKESTDAAAASQESAAAIDQISKVIGNVNNIVDKVTKEVSRFKC